MFLASLTTNKPNQSGTRTLYDYSQFLGNQTHRMGVVAQLCKNQTISNFTDRINNIVTKKAKKAGPITVESLTIEWDVDVNIIKRVPVAATPIGDGVGGSDVLFYFAEQYYNKNDIFSTSSHQQFIVLDNGKPKGRLFEYVCRINDNSYESAVDESGAAIGTPTMYITNAHPYDLDDEGYTKFQSNLEKHRTFMSKIRHDVTGSAAYLSKEAAFVKISKIGEGGADTGVDNSRIFKTNKMVLNAQENFMTSKSNAQLFGKCNVDINGKPKQFDKEGKPIITGDGIVPQIERFGKPIIFDQLGDVHFKEAMSFLTSKTGIPTGNRFICVCNPRFWHSTCDIIENKLQGWKTSGTFLWSKDTGSEIDMNNTFKYGATFTSYEYAGNIITFIVDNALGLKYDQEEFGMILDLNADLQNNRPAIESYTYMGCDMKWSTVKGVGGMSGLESGEVSSPVSGSRYIVWGYHGIAVYSPGNAVIFRQNR